MHINKGKTGEDIGKTPTGLILADLRLPGFFETQYRDGIYLAGCGVTEHFYTCIFMVVSGK